MNNEIKKVIEKFKEVKNILKDFSTKDEAIEYLVNETKLSKEDIKKLIEDLKNML